MEKLYISLYALCGGNSDKRNGIGELWICSSHIQQFCYCRLLGVNRIFSFKFFIVAASVLIFAVSMFGGSYIVRLFADNTSEVYQIAANGFTIFSYSFLFCGLNNFTSAMFTALSIGKVSAVLSFLRTFGLLAGGILLLPHIWGIAGVWMAVPVAEGIKCFVSMIGLIHYRKRYSY